MRKKISVTAAEQAGEHDNRQAVEPCLFEAAAQRLSASHAEQAAIIRPQVAAEAVADLPAELNPVTRYLSERNCRPESMAKYKNRLKRAQELLIDSGFSHGIPGVTAEAFPWHLIDAQAAAAFNSKVRSHFPSKKSAENILSICREVVRQCARVGLMSADQRDDVREQLPLQAISPSNVGRALEAEEIESLMRTALAARTPWIGHRNAAIVAALVGTGLRVSEVSDLDLRDVDLRRSCLEIRMTKTGSPRTAWLPPGSAEHLQLWLEVRGLDDGPLFSSNQGRRMSTSAYRKMVHQLAHKNGSARLTPHDFRRTYVTTLLRAGVDPFVVARAVGHLRVSTTLLYDRRSDEETRSVVMGLHVPSPSRRSSDHNGRRS